MGKYTTTSRSLSRIFYLGVAMSSPTITVLENILRAKYTTSFGKVNGNFFKNLRKSNIAQKFIEHRTKHLHIEHLSEKDILKYLESYHSHANKCKCCGDNIKINGIYCSIDCSNKIKNKKFLWIQKHKTKEDKQFKKLCSKNFCCLIETKEVISIRQWKGIENSRKRQIPFCCLIETKEILTNLEWTSRILLESLKNKPSPDPKYENMSAFRNRNRKGKTTIHKISEERMQNVKRYEKYRSLVYLITERNIKKFGLENIHLRGKDYQVDHMFSVVEGYERAINPVIIGDINNLKILTSFDNNKKNRSCSIELNDLLNNFKQFHGYLPEIYIN